MAQSTPSSARSLSKQAITKTASRVASFSARATLLTIFLVNAETVKANDSLAYFCEVKSVSQVDENGRIQEIKSGQNILTHYIGSKFKIVKATGEIDGPLVSNKTLNAITTTIIDKGGSMQSYKVLTVFGPNPSILYIQVDDFGADRGKRRYIFSGYRWQEFLTGICN